MIYLLLGPDSFSKKAYLGQIASEQNREVEVLDDLPPQDLAARLQPGLFGAAKFFAVQNYVNQLDAEQLALLALHPEPVAFLEDSLDKRKKETKALLGNKAIIVKEFVLPAGLELEQWVEQRVKQAKGKIVASAVKKLIELVGGQDSGPANFALPPIELWRLINEVDKLVTYADGETITHEIVEQLVVNSQEIQVWGIINALADRDLPRAFAALEGFLREAEGADEKSKIIQLNGLLADQFRNILMVQDFQQRRAPDSQILSATAWKSARLFVLKRIASRFKPQAILATLARLESLDEELKASELPPRVLLDMIAVQL